MGPRRRRFKSCRSDHLPSAVNIGESEGQAGGTPGPTCQPDTLLTQETALSDEKKVKFPKRVNYHGKHAATIYGKSETYPRYRVVWTAAGKRMMKSFPRYSDASGYAEANKKDWAKGSRATALTPGQANDALAALDRLQAHRQSTGRAVSLLLAVSAFCDADDKLHGRSLDAAVEGYLTTVATVTRMDLKQATEQFTKERKAKTVPSKPGKRPQLSSGYHYNVSMWLREFADTFLGSAVCDLTKDMLDLYMSAHSQLAPKTRNERRGALRIFLRWCVQKDYLPQNHRLLEAVSMAAEEAEPEGIQLYTAAELQAMLTRASMPPSAPKDGEKPEADYRKLQPVLALCALGGIRLQEVARLTWEDVFHVPDHVEITRTKSKTRSRRLVTICPALAQWLAPCRNCSGPIWPHCLDRYHRLFEAMLDELQIPVRRNALRHGFISAHYALHADEGLTSKEAGNSPAMVHKHYNGLMTKKAGKAWFDVAPANPKNIIPIAASTGGAS